MAISIKGGGRLPPGSQPKSPQGNAVAQAYARLEQKKSQKKKKGGAADAVGELLDEIVNEPTDLEAEAALARQMAKEILDDPPPGTGLEQAEAIAEKLKQKIEANRGQRAALQRHVQRRFDDLDE